MAEELLGEHADRIASVVIVPSSGGRFAIFAGRRTIFNKASAGRFPQPGEAARLLAEAL